MAGQGVGRRQILKILGTAAAAAQFPGFSKWGFACGHVGNAALQIKPAEYRPLFFTPSEYAMVERLTDIIIPTTRRWAQRKRALRSSSTSWWPAIRISVWLPYRTYLVECV